MRCRSGYESFKDLGSYAAFTLEGTAVTKPMTAFVTSFGKSLAPEWKVLLNKCSLVYHLDVVVNSGDKSSPFILTTSQMERVSKCIATDAYFY
jgi:hypothetical protein